MGVHSASTWVVAILVESSDCNMVCSGAEALLLLNQA